MQDSRKYSSLGSDMSLWAKGSISNILASKTTNIKSNKTTYHGLYPPVSSSKSTPTTKM